MSPDLVYVPACCKDYAYLHKMCLGGGKGGGGGEYGILFKGGGGGVINVVHIVTKRGRGVQKC